MGRQEFDAPTCVKQHRIYWSPYSENPIVDNHQVTYVLQLALIIHYKWRIVLSSCYHLYEYEMAEILGHTCISGGIPFEMFLCGEIREIKKQYKIRMLRL